MQLVKYEAMVLAINECHNVDEVKDIRDKARALEMYARQAKNTDAERKAADVRLRAERRTGELLRDMARSETRGGGDRRSSAAANQMSNAAINDTASEYSAALESAGLSRQTAHRYQQLAEVPRETFERALADPDSRPTTNGILRESRIERVQPIDPRALRVWGTARDFERHRDYESEPAELMAAMTETMVADMRRLAPILSEFWSSFTEEYTQ
jgi:hypothetical protein